MSKKDFITAYNGKLFRRVVIKGATVDDIPEQRERLQKLASEQGLEIIETDTTFDVYQDGHETGQKVLKPGLPREKVAKLYFKSNATEFDGGRGELPLASEIDGDAFTKDYGSVAYRYELVK